MLQYAVFKTRYFGQGLELDLGIDRQALGLRPMISSPINGVTVVVVVVVTRR
jgi:hypothetical protein